MKTTACILDIAESAGVPDHIARDLDDQLFDNHNSEIFPDELGTRPEQWLRELEKGDWGDEDGIEERVKGLCDAAKIIAATATENKIAVITTA